MDNEIMSIKLDDIIPNRFQPREVFDEEALEKLADSIRQHGVIEPIIVRPVSNKFEIVAGERRYKASVLAGLTKIPAIVKQMDDKESSIVAFIENEHRSDVSAIEEARTINRLLNNNNMTQEELAKELGIKQSTISNKLRLLNLPIEIQESLMKNEISERHARSLLTVKDEKTQIELLNKIKEKRMSVRELDSEIKNMNNMYNNNQMNNTFNPNEYLNSAPTNTPDAIPTDDGFMNFLNNYDNNNPLPVEEKQEVPANNEFVDFTNNYNANNQLPNDNLNVGDNYSNDGFMDYLNNYDTNNPLPVETNSTPGTSADDGFMQFLNNYDNNNPIPVEETKVESVPIQNNNIGGYNMPNYDNMAQPNVNNTLNTPPINNDYMGNMNTLPMPNTGVNAVNMPNNYNNQPMGPVGPITPNVIPSSPTPPADDDFMNYLNNYDNNNPLPQEEHKEESVTVQNNNIGGYNMPNYDNLTQTNVSTQPINNEYLNNNSGIINNPSIPNNDNLNNYNSTIEEVKEPSMPVEQFNEDLYSNFNSSISNPVINDVTPPITMGANDYIENNPNYVDLSKQVVISDVDSIISKLKDVVDEIKSTSKFKVDTDEINYDDIYQITIKIDKRDF